MKIEFYDTHQLQLKLSFSESEDIDWFRLWNGKFYSKNFRSQIHAERSKKVHNTTMDIISESIFEDICTINVLKNIKNKKMIFLELGAGWGGQTLDIAGIIENKLIDMEVKDYECIAIEAEPTHFKWLQETFRFNKINGISLFGAISDKIDFVKFQANVPPEDSYGQSIGDKGNIEIPCYTVDYLMNILKIEHIDIINMDVQGEEFKVICGSEKYIKEERIDYIIVGTHKDNLNDQIKTFLLPYFNCLIDFKPRSGIHNIENFPKSIYIPQDGIQIFKRKSL